MWGIGGQQKFINGPVVLSVQSLDQQHQPPWELIRNAETQSLGLCSRAADTVSQGRDLDPALVGMLMMCTQVRGSPS